MQIQPNLNIREDSEATIDSVGLTGGSYVEISGGTANSPLLVAKPGQPYPVIKAGSSTLQQLEQSAPLLMAKLNSAADKINDILNDNNRKALSGILANLNETTTVLARRSGDIDQTLRNVNVASAKLGPTLADADEGVKKFGKLATDADLFINGPGLGQISDVLADLRRLSESLTKLSDQLNHEPTKLLFGDRRKGYAPK
jgi:phospholipid/cholesterol/gamma-HCH transport system substrate-binding protein